MSRGPAQPDEVAPDERDAASPTLIDPPGRQGPGPLDAATIGALELTLARRASGALPGEHLAAGLGSGTELQQLRPYVEGDDVRHLDAAASARTGEPHVRLHVPERALTTWIALDVSASMAFGSRDRLKSDVAEGVVRVVARLTVRRGGRVALLRWGGPDVTTLLPPAGGRPALGAIDRVLAEGVAPDHLPAAENLEQALGRLHRVARRPGMVVVIGDLRDGSGWERRLSLLSRRHRLLVAEIGDPLEQRLPDVGVVTMEDPETGERLEVDTSSPLLRARFAAAEQERRTAVAQALRRARARHLVIDSEGDWLRALGRGLA